MITLPGGAMHVLMWACGHVRMTECFDRAQR